MNKEIELVAGEFRVLRLLFGRLESRPIEDESEFCQVCVLAQRGKQTVCPGKGIVGLYFGGGHVGQLESFALGEGSEEFLLGEWFVGVQFANHSQFLAFEFGGREGYRAVGYVPRIDGEHVKALVSGQALEIDRCDPFFVGFDVCPEKGVLLEEVQVGIVAFPSASGRA